MSTSTAWRVGIVRIGDGGGHWPINASRARLEASASVIRDVRASSQSMTATPKRTTTASSSSARAMLTASGTVKG